MNVVRAVLTFSALSTLAIACAATPSGGAPGEAVGSSTDAITMNDTACATNAITSATVGGVLTNPVWGTPCGGLQGVTSGASYGSTGCGADADLYIAEVDTAGNTQPFTMASTPTTSMFSMSQAECNSLTMQTEAFGLNSAGKWVWLGAVNQTGVWNPATPSTGGGISVSYCSFATKISGGSMSLPAGAPYSKVRVAGTAYTTSVNSKGATVLSYLPVEAGIATAMNSSACIR